MNPPTKPTPDTRYRVCRGGSWSGNDAARVRAAFRYWIAPSFRFSSVGFRCALRGREPLKVTP